MFYNLHSTNLKSVTLTSEWAEVLYVTVQSDVETPAENCLGAGRDCPNTVQ